MWGGRGEGANGAFVKLSAGDTQASVARVLIFRRRARCPGLPALAGWAGAMSSTMDEVAHGSGPKGGAGKVELQTCEWHFAEACLGGCLERPQHVRQCIECERSLKHCCKVRAAHPPVVLVPSLGVP